MADFFLNGLNEPLETIRKVNNVGNTSNYNKVYDWYMVNKKDKIAYYFFDEPKEGTRSREVLTVQH